MFFSDLNISSGMSIVISLRISGNSDEVVCLSNCLCVRVGWEDDNNHNNHTSTAIIPKNI